MLQSYTKVKSAIDAPSGLADDFAAELTHDLPADVETKSDAVLRIPTLRFDEAIMLEKAFHVPLLNADAIVFDTYLKHVTRQGFKLLIHRRLIATAEAGIYFDVSSMRCKFDGVSHQIKNDLHYSPFITADSALTLVEPIVNDRDLD